MLDASSVMTRNVVTARPRRYQVGDLMTAEVITAPETAGVPRLPEKMVRYHIKRVPPIVRDGKLIGSVSRPDVIGAIARSPESVVEAA